VARGHQWGQGRVIISLDASMAHRLISSSPISSRKPEEEVAPEEEVTQDRELKSTPADTSEFHNIDHKDNSSNNHDYQKITISGFEFLREDCPSGYRKN
jgi:hypothetical protein